MLDKKFARALPVLIAAALLVGACTRSEEHYAAQFDREADTVPELGGIREGDPAFYATVRADVSRRLAAGEEPAVVTADAVRQVNGHLIDMMPHLANAPAESQLATFRAERQLMLTLQPVDAAACVAVLNGTLQAGDMPEAGHEGFRRNIAVRIQAAQAGRDQPVTHAPITDADSRALVQALLAGGLTQVQVEAFGYGRPMAPDDAGQCAAGVRVFNVIDQLDPAIRERLVALMLATFAEQAVIRLRQHQTGALPALP